MQKHLCTLHDRARPCFSVQQGLMAGWILVAGLALTLPTIAQEAGTQRPPPTNNPAGTQLPRTSRTAPDSGGSRAPARGGRVPALNELLTTLDEDHDGKISKEEATGPYAQRFSQWDANRDGFATQEEVRNFRLRLGIDDNGQRAVGNNSGGTNTVPAAASDAGGAQGARGARGNIRGGARGAGTTATATLLKEPADWRFEAMPIPPGFAPEIKITGSEEIRFAPGMFDTSSSNYFTCVLAILADGAPELGAADIKDFLEKYYRGLSTGVGRRKGLSPDPAQMQAVVTPAPPGPDARNRFVAQVVFFDSFTDGRKITLNVEAQVIPQVALKQTCLIVLVSPSPKQSTAWQTLREIGKQTAASLP